jgi:glycosyltransferase involved in cell wall biosynthesis
VGDAAILVNPHDVDALSQAITRLIDNEGLREELRQKGFQRVQNFSWPRTARKMLAVYQRLYEGATDFST